MFGRRYFGREYFGPRYWGGSGSAVVVPQRSKTSSRNQVFTKRETGSVSKRTTERKSKRTNSD